MGLFSKKVDYDELYRKLSTEKMTSEEARKAEKELKKLAKSGDKRGVIWRPLTSVQIQSVGSVNWATSEFEEAEHKYGICEEYVRVRSLPIVFNLFNESYKKYNDPKGAVFVARAYEHGWGVEKNHEKAVEIIRETESYPKDGTFFVNSDLIKNAYKEITGKEFPDSESSEQKEKQAISGAAKNQNEQPQSDINFKRVEYDGGDVYEGEILNGKRHGHGTYTWADGDTYEGDWKDGKRCGRGKLIQYGKSPSGETYMKYSYDGEWLDSKEHGHGICVEGDFGMEKMDKVFEGEWVNGKRQGRFIWYLTNSNGGRYINFYEDGKWIEGGIPYDESIRTVEDARRARALADGKSSSTTPVYTNSSPAAAQESDDNGGDETEESDTGDNVLLRYQNGDSYRGAAVGGVREGFGAYFYADDGYYRGTFHQGVFHGYGIREYGNGHTYKGMWKNDTKNGYGEYTFADGRSYFGWWKDDCFQGFGCMTLSGGEVYVGEYENHKENGIILYNRGNKWSGYKAADGKVIGSSAGRWTAYKDGSEYCGPIIERRRGNTIYRVKEGFGEYCFPDDDSECPSDRYLGQFKDDMPYGTGIRLYTSPETDMPIIMASNDFRGDIIPRGHFQSVCGIKDPSGNCDFFLYYVGECKDSVCYGRGVMYVIGTTERSRYTPYGVKGGSIIYCDTFREHPDGPATVINRYGEELHGRFVDGMFEQYK